MKTAACGRCDFPKMKTNKQPPANDTPMRELQLCRQMLARLPSTKEPVPDSALIKLIKQQYDDKARLALRRIMADCFPTGLTVKEPRTIEVVVALAVLCGRMIAGEDNPRQLDNIRRLLNELGLSPIAQPDLAKYKPEKPEVSRVAYTADELCEELKISRVSLWRLEKRGLISPVAGIRHKRYSCDEVRRFLKTPSPDV